MFSFKFRRRVWNWLCLCQRIMYNLSIDYSVFVTRFTRTFCLFLFLFFLFRSFSYSQWIWKWNRVHESWATKRYGKKRRKIKSGQFIRYSINEWIFDSKFFGFCFSTMQFSFICKCRIESRTAIKRQFSSLGGFLFSTFFRFWSVSACYCRWLFAHDSVTMSAWTSQLKLQLVFHFFFFGFVSVDVSWSISESNKFRFYYNTDCMQANDKKKFKII